MKILGVVVSLLGGFLVGLAVLAWLWIPGEVKNTPLDVDTTTILAGEATLADDIFPVQVTSVTRVDSEASDDDVVVFENSTCVVRDVGDPPACVDADDPQERLLTASVDNFATDRSTALAVNDPDYLPAEAVPHEGLVNKWPFDAEKKDYPYWDGTSGEAVVARYDGATTIDGLPVYRYVVEIDDVPIELTEGVTGTYSTTKTIYVEPETGSVVKQGEEQERVTDEGDNFLSLDIEFTDEQVESSVEEAKDGRSQLRLITNTVPLIAVLLGIPLLLLGWFLIWRGGSRERGEHDPA